MDDGKKWESISAIRDCQEPIKVKKGDKLKLVAVYDMETHPLYVPLLTMSKSDLEDRREQHGGGHGEEMRIKSFSFLPDRDATR